MQCEQARPKDVLQQQVRDNLPIYSQEHILLAVQSKKRRMPEEEGPLVVQAVVLSTLDLRSLSKKQRKSGVATPKLDVAGVACFLTRLRAQVP